MFAVLSNIQYLLYSVTSSIGEGAEHGPAGHCQAPGCPQTGRTGFHQVTPSSCPDILNFLSSVHYVGQVQREGEEEPVPGLPAGLREVEQGLWGHLLEIE